MIKKLVKPENVENEYVVSFSEPVQQQTKDGGSDERCYADEEIDDITF